MIKKLLLVFCLFPALVHSQELFTLVKVIEGNNLIKLIDNQSQNQHKPTLWHTYLSCLHGSDNELFIQTNTTERSFNFITYDWSWNEVRNETITFDIPKNSSIKSVSPNSDLEENETLFFVNIKSKDGYEMGVFNQKGKCLQILCNSAEYIYVGYLYIVEDCKQFDLYTHQDQSYYNYLFKYNGKSSSIDKLQQSHSANTKTFNLNGMPAYPMSNGILIENGKKYLDPHHLQ